MLTRITGHMMTNTLLSNLYLNLGNLDKLQNQLSSGRNYAHISDNPSALIYSQAARNKLARLEHYRDTVGSAQNWLTQAEAGVMELQKVVSSIYEEVVNAGGAKTISDRQNIGMTVAQMRDHYLDTLNAAYGDRFVFGGYNTPGDYVRNQDPAVKPFTFDDEGNLLFNGFNTSQFDGMPSIFLSNSDPVAWDNFVATRMWDNSVTPPQPMYPNGLTDYWADPANQLEYTDPVTGVTIYNEDVVLMMHKLMNDVVEFEVGVDIHMPVTMNGLDVLFYTTKDDNGNSIMRNMYELLNQVHREITEEVPGSDPSEPQYVVDDMTKLIKLLQDGQNHLLVKTAEIGGRNRRLELFEARYEGDNINYETMRSNAEDADIAEVIMYMKMAETVYQAALSAGARVIQPSLMDFLR